MLTVTQDFKDNILATERQKIYCRVTIDYSDPFLDTSLTITANESNRITENDHVANGKEIIPVKYTSLDGSWILDNTYFSPPETDESLLVAELGWQGNTLCDENGDFAATYPMLTVEFSARSIRGLKVVGDYIRNEYPVDFEIVLYDKNDTVLLTQTVTGNASYRWDLPITLVSEVTKMTLEIKKWNVGHRVVKIAEFFTSIQEIYEGDDIISVSLLEEREISNGSLPIGNITANEVDIKLNNVDHIFDAGNNLSRLYGLVRPNRRVRLEFGLLLPDDTIEWVSKGTFWTGEWEVPDDDIYASFSARDRLELLRRDNFSNSQVIANPVNQSYTRNSEADWNDGTLTRLKALTTGYLTLNIVR